MDNLCIIKHLHGIVKQNRFNMIGLTKINVFQTSSSDGVTVPISDIYKYNPYEDEWQLIVNNVCLFKICYVIILKQINYGCFILN